MDSEIKNLSERRSPKSELDESSALSDVVNATIFLSNNVSLSLSSDSLIIQGIA